VVCVNYDAKEVQPLVSFVIVVPWKYEHGMYSDIRVHSSTPM